MAHEQCRVQGASLDSRLRVKVKVVLLSWIGLAEMWRKSGAGSSVDSWQIGSERQSVFTQEYRALGVWHMNGTSMDSWLIGSEGVT